jgi:5-methyltetrahydropteroyltriglutamate--homocysteine methyltransferase
VQVRDAQFLKAHTSRRTKMTVPGPFTMSQQAQDDFYGAPDKLGMAYAEAVRGEILDLFEAGVDIVQVDEPYMQARPEPAREYGLDALKHATHGLPGTSAVHICFGYAAIIHERPSGYSFLPELAATEADQISIETAQSGLALDVLDELPDKTIILGVLDLSTDDVETPETVAERIRRAIPHKPPERLIAAPDCGMKYLSRAAAYGKLESLVAGAKMASERS